MKATKISMLIVMIMMFICPTTSIGKDRDRNQEKKPQAVQSKQQNYNKCACKECQIFLKSQKKHTTKYSCTECQRNLKSKKAQKNKQCTCTGCKLMQQNHNNAQAKKNNTKKHTPEKNSQKKR